MQREDLRPLPGSQATRPARVRAYAPPLLQTLFILSWLALLIKPWFPALHPVHRDWGYTTLALLALATLAAGLLRWLPAQNVFLACLLLGLAGLGLHLLEMATGIPLGLLTPEPISGEHWFWLVPLLWTVVLLDCRGVARILLQPWRNDSFYGYWVLGTTAALVMLFKLTLTPFAAATNLWSAMPASLTSGWYGTPWLALPGCAAAAVLSLALVTPTLINKIPVACPVDYPPVWIWLLLKASFGAGLVANRCWTAAVLCLCEIAVVIALATSARRRRSACQNPCGPLGTDGNPQR